MKMVEDIPVSARSFASNNAYDAIADKGVGEVVLFEKGIDYPDDASPEVVRSRVLAGMRKRGVRVKTRITEEGIYFKIRSKE